MTQDEYIRFDGLTLADLVQRREVSPLELLDAAIARIEQQNPTVNAVVHKRYEAARQEAATINLDAPFAGVPFLVKDLLANIAGEPTGSGNRLLAGIAMPRDSEHVSRWRATGLQILGRTNTPEFGLTPFTEPALYGATRNPWSLDHSPGGSSGGSAAAVAARMVPLASGGDGGGSIRVPASCCGLFGLKPSRGLMPTGPDNTENWHGYAADHVISRSVRDSAAMLDATAGPDAGAPYAAPARQRSYLEETQTPPGRLRIAFSSAPLFGHSVHPDCVAGLQESAKLLASLGHAVEEAGPVIDRDACAIAFVTVLAGEMRADIEATARLAGKPVRSADFELSTFAMGLLGRTVSAADYATASRTLQAAARQTAQFFQQYDVLVTPTLGAPPVLIGTLQPSAAEQRILKVVNRLNAGWLLGALGIIKPLARKTFDYIPFTPLFNVSGQPAMSVPLHWNAAGLPIGMQFVARLGEEPTLLRLAAQLEQARPWAHRVAPGF